MGLEIEARFRADGRRTLDGLGKRPILGRAALGAARTVEEEDRYLDTHDRRLGRVRWACRLRTRDGSTRISLKGPPETPATGWLHQRPELEGPATMAIDPDAWPESAARDLLLDLSGGAPLREWLRLRQERTERPVTLGDRLIGALSLDVVTAERGDERLGELYIVELEIEAGGDPRRDLEALAGALAEEPGLEAEPRTKLELALQLSAPRTDKSR